MDPASPWLPSPSSARRSSDQYSLRNNASRQPPWNWDTCESRTPRPRSPSNTALDSPISQFPDMPPLNIRPPPRARPDNLRIPTTPRRSVSMAAGGPAASAVASPPLRQHPRTESSSSTTRETREREDSTLGDPEDLHLFAEAMAGLDGGFMGPAFQPAYPQSAGPSARSFDLPDPAGTASAQRTSSDSLRPAAQPVHARSQPGSRSHTPDFGYSRTGAAHHASYYQPPGDVPVQPQAAPPALPAAAHTDPSRLFAESLMNMDDGNPDDELPDYATSQREAANANRQQALQRAQDLERRWTAARFNRRR